MLQKMNLKTGDTPLGHFMNSKFNHITKIIMNRTFYIFLLSFLFLSCNNEDSHINLNNDTNGDICSFLFDIGNEDFSSYWSVDDTIGITTYISNSEELYLNGINKRYKSSGDSIFVPATKEDIVYHPLAGNFVDFIAYYPYKADATTTYAISLSEQSDQKQIDLLYSNNAKNKTNVSGDIKFVFNHVLSKIVIKTTPSGGLVKEDLHGMDIIINNISSEGTFSLVDGYIEPSNQKSSIKMKTEPDGSSSEAIILPETTSGISFTIELTNGYVYHTNFYQEQQFISGQIHTYNIIITQTGISFSPIDVEEWIVTDKNPQEKMANEIEYKTGDFYPNPNNPETAVGIVYWLKPGTNGKEGKIVSYDSAIRNWGDSNNENLKTSISTGIINWEIIINVDPSLENFPAFKWCRDKGEGWFLPSRYELHVLNELWLAHGEYMNSNILSIGGEPFTSDDIYLVSSESRSEPNDKAETYNLSTKGWLPIDKNVEGRIRAVKEF